MIHKFDPGWNVLEPCEARPNCKYLVMNQKDEVNRAIISNKISKTIINSGQGIRDLWHELHRMNFKMPLNLISSLIVWLKLDATDLTQHLKCTLENFPEDLIYLNILSTFKSQNVLSLNAGLAYNEKKLSLDHNLVSFSTSTWVRSKEHNCCWMSFQIPIDNAKSTVPSKTRIKDWRSHLLSVSQVFFILLSLTNEPSLLVCIIFNRKSPIVVCAWLAILKCLCEVEVPSTCSWDEHEVVRIVRVVYIVFVRKWRYLSSFSRHKWTEVKNSVGRKHPVILCAKESQFEPGV